MKPEGFSKIETMKTFKANYNFEQETENTLYQMGFTTKPVNMMRILIFLVCVIIFLFQSVDLLAVSIDKKNLPVEEQKLADTVDHWGLSFSDQLNRFNSGADKLKDELKEKTPQNFIVGIQHGLEKVPLNKYWFKGEYTSKVSIKAARNEYENFQVAVLPRIGKTLGKVTLQAGKLQHEAGKYIISENEIKLYRVAYVETQQACYPTPYTGKWPDPLLPNDVIFISGTNLGLFWVEVKVPQNAQPGMYYGILTLEADNEKVDINLSLDVYSFVLPDRVEFPLAVWTNKLLPSNKEMDIESYRQLWKMLLEHSIDPLSVGTEYFSFKDMNFKVLDENIEYCLEKGLQVFEISKAEPNNLKPLVEHLREKDFLKKALVYSCDDEPDEDTFINKNVPYYTQIHCFSPDLRVFLATEYHPCVNKGCDIWLNDLSTGKGIEFALKNKGNTELWTYYCHLPIHVDYHRPLVQAPNMLIDNEAIEHRIAFWLAWKYKIKGMLIWAGNNDWEKRGIDRSNWEKTGWELPSPDMPLPYPYAGVHNGNGYLIYPGHYPSIRMKILRDGMEDLGYLKILDEAMVREKNKNLKKQAQQILSVSPELLVNSHYFNRDPSALLAERERIAQMIEKMSGCK
jgi:hypothetical protein